MKILDFKLNADWCNFLEEELMSTEFKLTINNLKEDKIKNIVYPENKLIFNALNLTSVNKLKVVILGQDPYHGRGQSNGVAFSVNKGIKKPPSLKNIEKELVSDLELNYNQKFDLLNWAKQGVLLLNSILTVRANNPNSHKMIGWEKITDALLKKVSLRKREIIFILWGKFAQKKESLIDTNKHYILKAPHPSPLSAYKGFFGCKHFSKTNKILIKNNQQPIIW